MCKLHCFCWRIVTWYVIRRFMKNNVFLVKHCGCCVWRGRDFVLGSAVEDMQVGCLWQGDYLITVSLSGFINYLDKSSGRLSRVVKVWHTDSWYTVLMFYLHYCHVWQLLFLVRLPAVPLSCNDWASSPHTHTHSIIWYCPKGGMLCSCPWSRSVGWCLAEG